MNLVFPKRDACFLGEHEERRFCLFTHAMGRPRGAILYVHPFAEELNRSRRMVALATQAFAQQGWSVLQMDLRGCGDSEGDFSDACWDSWLADLDRAHAWLNTHLAHGGPTVLWSLRAGSLLASSWLAQRGLSLPWLAWQPVFQGAQYLTQFLRIRLGADLASSSQSGNVLAELRAALKGGETVSVGGYGLSAALARGLEGSSFALHPGFHAPVSVIEVASGEPPELPPATSNWLNKARQAGHACEGVATSGNRFWQSAEVEVALDMIAPSQAALQGWAP
ncbi:MAG: hydrolase 2, exosortase A system-associated [Burkholderiales bacterium]|nr:hydrolase 2, exosortase A system-associated [Burkholderiales bacterium]MBH2015232.1 hydrolase 2, exosortase A system-associated [Burkholderiales bacterium]